MTDRPPFVFRRLRALPGAASHRGLRRAVRVRRHGSPRHRAHLVWATSARVRPPAGRRWSLPSSASTGSSVPAGSPSLPAPRSHRLWRRVDRALPAGTWYVERIVANSSDTYGVFVVVFGLLSWCLLLGMLFLYSNESQRRPRRPAVATKPHGPEPVRRDQESLAACSPSARSGSREPTSTCGSRRTPSRLTRIDAGATRIRRCPQTMRSVRTDVPVDRPNARTGRTRSAASTSPTVNPIALSEQPGHVVQEDDATTTRRRGRAAAGPTTTRDPRSLKPRGR